jgi:hypothetical protein
MIPSIPAKGKQKNPHAMRVFREIITAQSVGL